MHRDLQARTAARLQGLGVNCTQLQCIFCATLVFHLFARLQASLLLKCSLASLHLCRTVLLCSMQFSPVCPVMTATIERIRVCGNCKRFAHTRSSL